MNLFRFNRNHKNDETGESRKVDYSWIKDIRDVPIENTVHSDDDEKLILTLDEIVDLLKLGYEIHKCEHSGVPGHYTVFVVDKYLYERENDKGSVRR